MFLHKESPNQPLAVYLSINQEISSFYLIYTSLIPV